MRAISCISGIVALGIAISLPSNAGKLEAVGRPLPPGATVVERGNVFRRVLGWGHRPKVVVTRANAATMLTVGKKIKLSTLYDERQTVPAQFQTFTTRTTFRTSLDGPDLLDPPSTGEYFKIEHPTTLTLRRPIRHAYLAGAEKGFTDQSGLSFVGYKVPDSVSLKGTLEEIRENGSVLVVRRAGGKSVALRIDDPKMKVLAEQ